MARATPQNTNLDQPFGMKSQMNWPRITVVTPNLNRDRFIEEAIRSVLNQGYPDLEYIVIDGGSTDGSVETIKKYSKEMSFWKSEKDRGQADAINKGFEHSTGTLLGWLNSDDILAPGALFHLGRAHLEEPHAIIAGDVENFSATGYCKTIHQRGLNIENYITSWNQVWQQRIGYHQPGVFFPRIAWEKCGPLDISLRYCFDSDLMYRMLQNSKVVYLNTILARFRLHLESKTMAEGDEFQREADAVLRRYWTLGGRTPDLKSYSMAMGGMCVARWRYGQMVQGIRILGRGLGLFPIHALAGVFIATAMGFRHGIGRDREYKKLFKKVHHVVR